MSAVDVVVADDHELVRAAIAACLEQSGRMRCLGEAGTGAAAIELVTEHEPPIALVDLGLPDIDGFEVTRRIADAGCRTRVIVVSGRISTDLVQQAFDAGAWGYVSKVSSVELLPDAIDAVLEGARYVDREVADDLARSVHGVLDEGELRVLAHMAAGRDDHAIARQLRLDVTEVTDRVDSLLDKLGYASRGAAISHAILQGMAE